LSLFHSTRKSAEFFSTSTTQPHHHRTTPPRRRTTGVPEFRPEAVGRICAA